MFKKIMLTMALMACSSALFAVQCPGAADFEKKGGTFWGYYWDFKTGANTESWIMNYWIMHSNALATAENFPEDTPLEVVFYDKLVQCYYTLKDINNEKLELSLSKSPKSDSIPNSNLMLTFSTPSYWMGSGSDGVVKLGSCATTAGNPKACSWEWSI